MTTGERIPFLIAGGFSAPPRRPTLLTQVARALHERHDFFYPDIPSGWYLGPLRIP